MAGRSVAAPAATSRPSHAPPSSAHRRRTPVLPVVGTPNWYCLVLLSPYAGIYYWRSGDRVDDVQVKLAESDDGTRNEITIEGNDEEIDRMWRTLELREKGMVPVEGLLG